MSWHDVTAEQWQTFVATRPEANVLQAREWGELHEALGDTVIRRGVFDGDVLVGGYQAIVKDARRGRYLEVPGAPLLDWHDAAMVQAATADLRVIAKAHACVFVRVRPQLSDSAEYRTQLQQAGFRKAPFHLHAEHTSILSLTPSEDELLAGMRRQTRYEVRRSDKQGVEVSVHTGREQIDEFYELQADTARRQGFVPSPKEFLVTLAEVMGDNLRVYRAEKDGQLLNMALVLWSGEEADYYEAASTPGSRQYAGAYGLQWRAIRDAKAAGKTRYNFWGIAYSDDPNHRYAGVTTFKRGFGGADETFVPAHDLVIDYLRYPKNWIIETIRRKKRKL